MVAETAGNAGSFACKLRQINLNVRCKYDCFCRIGNDRMLGFGMNDRQRTVIYEKARVAEAVGCVADIAEIVIVNPCTPPLCRVYGCPRDGCAERSGRILCFG